jgi:transcriptional regulator with XRE-family HTH domain
MITASQLRAARALLGIDQLFLAQRASLSLPTIQRMETSGGLIRGNVDSMMKVIQALEDMGVELIAEGSTSSVGGRGVRLREREARTIIREQKLGARQQLTLTLSAANDRLAPLRWGCAVRSHDRSRPSAQLLRHFLPSRRRPTARFSGCPDPAAPPRI